ncbi:MAG: dihydroorotate dehydrogenase electron transfer subunit [Magnetococcales bacterium]|nr:dihydroorotate dehydrogenase electron transfer subunit [Magnetococcales bacterium]
MISSLAPCHILARVRENRPLGDRFFLLILEAPEIALRATPGRFLQVDCDPSLTLPRPFSIMAVDREGGTVAVFYKVVGTGTRFMQQWPSGTKVWVLGPLGSSFSPPPPGRTPLMVAGGVGLAPLRFLGERLSQGNNDRPLLLWGVEAETIPWATTAPRLKFPEDPITHPVALAWEEEQGIVSRLASLKERDGFFHGRVGDLLDRILAGIPDSGSRFFLYVCGPWAMMAAVAQTAARWHIPGEVSLEGTMACGFGGCAGCAVPVYQEENRENEWRYVRSCTEGPVLPMERIVWHTHRHPDTMAATKKGKGDPSL